MHKSKNIFRIEQREENDYKRKHLAGIVSISFNGHQAKKRFHLATKKSLEQIASPKKTDFTREFWPPKKLDLSKISMTNGQFSGQDPLLSGICDNWGSFRNKLAKKFFLQVSAYGSLKKFCYNLREFAFSSLLSPSLSIVLGSSGGLRDNKYLMDN